MPAADQSPIPNPQSRAAPAKESARISGMFDAIAARYDLLNHLLSAGLDKQWRKRAVAALQLTGQETVLDLCTGTADLALAAMSGPQRARRVVGIDFSAAMLQIGQEKVRSVDPRSHSHQGGCHSYPARRRNGRRGDDRVRHPQCGAARVGMRGDCQGASSWRKARDPGIFTATLQGAAQFLPLVFPPDSAVHRAGRFEAPERLHVSAGIG